VRPAEYGLNQRDAENGSIPASLSAWTATRESFVDIVTGPSDM
jgi:hypothetical protein